MRHKYATTGIVLARAPLGEANLLLTLLTHELGLLRARAQGIRKNTARLKGSLSTFVESDLILIKGVEGWRVAGAVNVANHFQQMSPRARQTASRITGLLLRLAPGELGDPRLYTLISAFFAALNTSSQDAYDAVECLAALNILAMLGLDAGSVPARFDADTLAVVAQERRSYVRRINTGLEASGL